MDNKYTFTLKLPADLGEKLKASAQRNLRSIQAETVFAIREYLEKQPLDNEPKGKD